MSPAKRVSVNEWPQAYLESAIDDEIALAKAMHPGAKILRPGLITPVTQLTFDYPRRTHGTSTHNARTGSGGYIAPWRRDWRAAGPLIAEFDLRILPDTDEGTVSVGTGGGRRNVTEEIADHPDKDAAIIAAMVRFATQLAEARTEQ